MGPAVDRKLGWIWEAQSPLVDGDDGRLLLYTCFGSFKFGDLAESDDCFDPSFDVERGYEPGVAMKNPEVILLLSHGSGQFSSFEKTSLS
ncbi:hypothetical protein IMZ48_41330 [Candidatus Bathyarchaeota archaeon]|nr:hypothetical protein [Candidatus Bathyarchaeota archaeon]